MERNPTVHLVGDEQADAILQQTYEMCKQAMGGVPHLTRAIANCQELVVPFMQLAGAVATEHVLPAKVKQLAVLRAAELNGCSYCRSIHVPKAAQLGVDQHKVEGVKARDLPRDLFSDEEELVIRMTDEMTGEVGAKRETVERAKKLWGDAGAIELMMTIAFYNLMNRLAESSQVPLEG
jgi:AhpD family alkylhydroperoxidase